MGISLLIVEEGACWVERAHTWRKPTNEIMVLAQNRDESHRQFRERVEQRLERMRLRGLAADQVALVASSKRDPSALLARAHMLRLLFRDRGTDEGRPSLLRAASAESDISAERSIRALAQTVFEELGASAQFQRVSSSSPV